MYNIIKTYSSCWERFIDYIYLVENKKLSGKESLILLMLQALFSFPLLAFVCFLLYPLPNKNAFNGQTLFYVWISMIAFAFGSSAFSANVIKYASEKIPTIPSDSYKKHLFVATVVFYILGGLFIFAFIEYFAPLLMEAILKIRELIFT